jgi:hypothetical protein
MAGSKTKLLTLVTAGALLLTGLCILIALSLFQQQSAMTQVLRENVTSRRAAVDLETCLYDISALLEDNVDDVSSLNDRLEQLLDRLREVADQDVELDASRQLDRGLTEYLASWNQLPPVQSPGHEEAVRATLRVLNDRLIEPCQQFRLYNGRRIEQSTASLPEEAQASEGGDPLIGQCPEMQELYKGIGRVAAQDVTTLLLGESGTGKELVARAIYQHSNRAKRAFLAINCAAIPEQLLESELFGHERGAFTGSDRKRIGKFEQCHGGTIFLDEVAELTPLMQAKILRLIQEQRFERVGGSEAIATDVRIIAATNANLSAMVDSPFLAWKSCGRLTDFFLLTLIHGMLGAMLVYTGFRLASPKEFVQTLRIGPEQLVVFIGTIVATLATDLLIGIGVGIALKWMFQLWHGVPFRALFQPDIDVIQDGETGAYTLTVRRAFVFSNWLSVRSRIVKQLESTDSLTVDLRHAKFVDHTVQCKLQDLSRELLIDGKELLVTGLNHHRPLSSHPHAARKSVPSVTDGSGVIAGCD